MVEIRPAEEKDIAVICSFDHVARQSTERQQFIIGAVRSRSAFVAIVDGDVVGYSALDYSFFSQGFISVLYVHPDFRRQGIGSALVRHAEAICTTAKLFTSTNESNLPMQALMVKLQFVPSGVINNLDEGDPELVYFKRLRGSS